MDAYADKTIDKTLAKAEKGETATQNKLSSLYGFGPREDCAEAFKWLHKAAERGDPEAEYLLALLNSLTANYTEAVKWCRKAAEKGHATAQNMLGLMYRDGRGVTKDAAQAFEWIR